MFADAIEQVAKFTRPIYSVRRRFWDNALMKDSGTLFFVNDEGVAVTAKHVAAAFMAADQLSKKYNDFKTQRAALKHDATFQFEERLLANRCGIKKDSIVEIANMFCGCVKGETQVAINIHPKYDLAIIKFINPQKLLYEGHAVFAKDMCRVGTTLCRIGYPFPEYTNYRYNELADKIEFTNEGKTTTPFFPVEGMMTRTLIDADRPFGVEISTPGMLASSGGPLFDRQGRILGLQFSIATIKQTINPSPQGDIIEQAEPQVFDYKLGVCIHPQVIKDFLRANGVKFFEE